MKKLFPILLLLPLLLSGCARHHIITLMSGNQITTIGKPKFQNGEYQYTTTQGEVGRISSARVREISPASMVKESSGHNPKPTK